MTGREFTLKYQFNDVGKLENNQILSSPIEDHYDLNFMHVRIQRSDNNLSMYLYTNLTENQEVHVDYTFKEFLGNKENTRAIFGSKVFKGQRHRCISIAWKTVEKEYLNDGRLEVEYHAKITKMIGFSREKLRSFGEEMKQFSDVILKVEDRKFYVSKLYLSSQSSYFATLFLGQFQESEKSEIKLKDVNPQDFQYYLEVIYAEDGIDEYTVERILAIADMYDTPLVVKKCEKYLVNESKMELEKKKYAWSPCDQDPEDFNKMDANAL
ncbi:Protein CBG19527 [Caenorhabditis briggsae]|uniref:Protein CBG19527 n=1 Tax=Caenorhabditis briggsae TaxID=6238 RepID=A8XVT8_CAEBR|nr:Protein CBG19527 [Caenorhabditis briggsae]CAP36757.1 Protein CBG19527 [Caenorhabditis briggsae]